MTPKITRFQSSAVHTKNQEDLKLNYDRKSTDANTKMLGLSDKNFKAAIITMLQQAIMNMLETN